VAEETPKKGTEHIIIVMDSVLAIGTDIHDAMADGKITLPEILGMSKDLPGAIAAIKAAPDLPGELSDLDDAERDQIIAHFADKFELPNHEVEKRVERLFRVAVNFAEQVAETIAIVKEFKAKG
jgi:hypothetical protein